MPSSAAATSRIICLFKTLLASCSPGVSISTTCAFSRVTIPWMRLRVVCGFEVTMAIFCPTSRFTSVDFPAFGRPTIATNPARYPLLFSFVTPCLCASVAALPLSFFFRKLKTYNLRLTTACHLCEPCALRASALSFSFSKTENGERKTENFFRSPRVHGRAGKFLRPHSQHLALVRFQHFKAKPLQIKFFAGRRNSAAHMAQQSRNGGHRIRRTFAKMNAQHVFHIVDGGAAAHHQRARALAHHF